MYHTDYCVEYALTSLSLTLSLSLSLSFSFSLSLSLFLPLFLSLPHFPLSLLCLSPLPPSSPSLPSPSPSLPLLGDKNPLQPLTALGLTFFRRTDSCSSSLASMSAQVHFSRNSAFFFASSAILASNLQVNACFDGADEDIWHHTPTLPTSTNPSLAVDNRTSFLWQQMAGYDNLPNPTQDTPVLLDAPGNNTEVGVQDFGADSSHRRISLYGSVNTR